MAGVRDNIFIPPEKKMKAMPGIQPKTIPAISYESQPMKNHMNLYFVASNRRHIFQATVTLWSIVSCDDSSTRYNVFLKTELEEKTWRGFFLPIPRVSVYGVPFNVPYEQSVLLKKMKDLDGNDSRKYFYHKFDLTWTESISHLLTDDRLLLLDTDLYARKPLRALYETPLADHECMAMVIDTGIWKYPEWVLEHNRSLGIDHPCFYNTGVALIHISSFVEHHIWEKSLEAYPFPTMPPQHDQDILNRLIFNNATRDIKRPCCKTMPSVYNMSTKWFPFMHLEKDDIALVHAYGDTKLPHSSCDWANKEYERLMETYRNMEIPSPE